MSGPERIWITKSTYYLRVPGKRECVEYIRADLHETVVRELEIVTHDNAKNAQTVRDLRAAYEEKERELDEARNISQAAMGALKDANDEITALRRALDELSLAVLEMHNDNVKGDFDLPPLARLDLDACVEKARMPRVGGGA